ncbi:ABC transporter permease [Hazenella sp. IB182357]|uniref:ABC transporter permease n=1 Tax=Polycladospora coralii TaxID=2771432 RepID=A0A926RSA7_9BACL|nr:ABC transporter permease [Polycladospora coralii]MBD1370845.1 ABC transporter permease [Polycladospora coralii]MBS7529784.1 ABC transporter permease [Polycladospora coralii]
MHYRTLAKKSLLFHARSYLAYFYSCIFTVILFYLYTALLYHPILEDSMVSEAFVGLIYMVEVIIGLFAILFLGYSQSAFLHNRKKDLAVFQVLGMSVKQMTRLVFWENCMIGFISIVIGIGLSIACSNYFFLGISKVLRFQDPIVASSPGVPALVTAITFLFIFILLSWWSRFSFRKVSIRSLFHVQTATKKEPRFSIWLVGLALISIATGYGLALSSSLSQLAQLSLMIGVLLLIGTYFLITQTSVWFVDQMTKTSTVQERSLWFLFFTNLRYRLADHTKIIFMVSILTSIVLSVVGICIMYGVESERVAEKQAPFHLSVIDKEKVMNKQVVALMNKHEMKVKEEIHLPILTDVDEYSQYAVISIQSFNQLRKNQRQPLLQIGDKEAVLAKNSGIWKDDLQSVTPYRYQLSGLKQKPALKITHELTGIYFNEHDQTRFLLIVSEAQFHAFSQQVQQADQQVQIHGYQFNDWHKSKVLFEELSDQTNLINGTYLFHSFLLAVISPLTFVSCFIGALLLLGLGSILYFKSFTELSLDRNQMQVLNKMGLSFAEILRVYRKQISVLFYRPFVVGSCHAVIVMYAFSFLFDQTPWLMIGLVMGGYLILYSGYYKWTVYHYRKQASVFLT